MMTRGDQALRDWAERYLRMLDGSAIGFSSSTLTAFTRGRGGGIPGAQVPRGVVWPAHLDLVHRLMFDQRLGFSAAQRRVAWYAYLVPGLSAAERVKAYKEDQRCGVRAYYERLHEVTAIVDGALRAQALGFVRSQAA